MLSITNNILSFCSVFYVLSTSIVALVLVAPFVVDDFQSTVTMGMFDSLSRRYGIKTTITDEWDILQHDNQCCGANNLTDWSDSEWVKRQSSSSALPRSCELSLLLAECSVTFSSDEEYIHSHSNCSESVQGCAGIYYESLAHVLQYYTGVNITYVVLELTMLIILLFLPKGLRIDAYGTTR